MVTKRTTWIFDAEKIIGLVKEVDDELEFEEQLVVVLSFPVLLFETLKPKKLN